VASQRIAARKDHHISPWTFTEHHLVVTSVTIAVAWSYVGLRYFAA
jgi:hypothetical protein